MKKLNVKFSLPQKLVAVLLFTYLLGDLMPTSFKEIAYAISLTIKAALVFTLPFIVFSCIFSSLLEIKKKNAIFLVALILIAICFSNFISTMVAFSIGKILIHQNWLAASIESQSNISLNPYWTFSLSPLISNEKTLILSLLVGILASLRPSQKITQFSYLLGRGVNLILNQAFIPLVPLFVLGFTLKLHHEKVLSMIVKNYTPIFILVVVVEAIYIAFLYSLGSGFNIKVSANWMKNALPSMISGFSTMSSAASMPLTLKGAEKNTKNPEFAKTVIPMTVNNHLVGDSLFIPLVGLLLLVSSGKPMPSGIEYLPFAFYFVAAKFAVAAVPGGGIIVMLPILEKYLGLNADVLSLMTALYILFDPFITSANVAGNGAFAILLSKLSRSSFR